MFGGDGSSGVQVPAALIDRFVLMRFAEMLVDGTADGLLGEMSSEGGNVGMLQLLGNMPLVQSSVRDLQSRARRATVDDVWGGASD